MDDADIFIIDKTKIEDMITWDFIFTKLSIDPISHIFSFLSFYELSLCSIISLEWYHNTITNNRLWLNLCQTYWSTKTYVPSQYRNLIINNNKNISKYAKKQEKHKTLASECIARQAFRLAYMDRKRTTLTVDELMNFKWYFRFKPEAGETWLNIDPFWNLNDESDESDEDKINWDDDIDTNNDNIMQYKPSELVGILTDDEIEEYKLKQLKYQQSISMQENKNKKILSEHEKRLLRCTRIEFNSDGSMQFEQNRRMNDMANTQEFVWRFGGNFYKENMFGDAVQINSYPKKYISRHPVHWGWIMQSCWVIYTSFEMPLVGSYDDKLINTNDFGLRGYAEMIQYNYMGGVIINQQENGNDDEDDGKQWMDENNMVDLEYLKEMKENMSNGVDENNCVGNEMDENDVDLQYAIAQFLQRFTG